MSGISFFFLVRVPMSSYSEIFQDLKFRIQIPNPTHKLDLWISQHLPLTHQVLISQSKTFLTLCPTGLTDTCAWHPAETSLKPITQLFWTFFHRRICPDLCPISPLGGRHLPIPEWPVLTKWTKVLQETQYVQDVIRTFQILYIPGRKLR